MSITVIKTIQKGTERLTAVRQTHLKKDHFNIEANLIVLFPEAPQQEIEGFGGAFTEAASVTLDKLSPAKRHQVMRAYFDPDEGIGYHFCRTHIGSCDFAVDPYTHIEEGDKTLATFSLERDRKSLIPMIKEAMAMADVRLFASPWSPPAFMKSNNKRWGGGKLLPEYYDLWADYFKRYIQEYKKEGIPIWAVTAQNEPNAAQTWESCAYTAQEECDFIKNHLGPCMADMDVKLLCWDHNKERLFERAQTILSDPDAAKYVWGVAFHWYSGDHFEQIDLLSRLYPGKKLAFTEGCRDTKTQGPKMKKGWDIAESYAHDIIGNFNNGCSIFTDWNMILDEKNGPYHQRAPFIYCDAPIIINTKKDEIIYEPSYYYIGHFSKYVRRGAKRIVASRFTDKLQVLAFVNPDGTVVCVVLNRTNDKIGYALKMNGKLAHLKSEAHSITTLLINNE